MRSSWIGVVLCSLAAACAPSPGISGVEPTHADCAADVALRIRGEALGQQVQVDLGSGAVGRVYAVVGGIGLRDVRVVGGAVIEGTLPGGQLAAGGDYDVNVQTASGAEATLPAAFHCDGEVLPDGGDDGDGGEPDAPEGDAEADGEAGPLGTVVTISEAGSSRVGSAATVAWVVDRWVIAYVVDDGAAGLLRLAEVLPGATEPSTAQDQLDTGTPTDPLIRAWAGAVWLSWMDRGATPQRWRFRLLDDGLGVRVDGGPLGSADADVLWRRDHDVARDSTTGSFGFVAPVLGTMTFSLVGNDGTVPLRNVSLGAVEAAPGEPRVVWASGAWRLAWWENVAAGAKVRAAVLEPAGAIRSGPLDLSLGGVVASPVLWPDARGGVERLFLCYESSADAMTRRIRYRFFDDDFGTPSAEFALEGTGRAARCAVADGLLAWSLLSAAPSFSLTRLAADGSTEDVVVLFGRGVRASPGVDMAAGPDGPGLVWLQDRAPGEPVAVRFAEVRAGP
jgi:hypothetical protein